MSAYIYYCTKLRQAGSTQSYNVNNEPPPSTPLSVCAFASECVEVCLCLCVWICVCVCVCGYVCVDMYVFVCVDKQRVSSNTKLKEGLLNFLPNAKLIYLD